MSGNVRENEDENRDEDGRERERVYLRGGKVGEPEDARRRVTPKNNKQSQPQHPTPQ